MLKIYIGFGTPDLLGQFLSCHHLSGPVDQNVQKFRWLRLKLYESAAASKLTSFAVQFVLTEKDVRSGICLRYQSGAPKLAEVGETL